MGLLGNLGQLSPTSVNRAEPLLEIFTLVAGDTSSPTHIGMFGAAGAPNSPVVVGLYQDHTFRVNRGGSDFGVLINNKFRSATTVTVSGTFTGGGVLQNVNLNVVPGQSGTLLLRFKEPNNTNIITQNGVFRAINLTAASGAADVLTAATGITIQAAQLIDTHGNASDTTWTQIGGIGSPTTLTLADQAGETPVHDWHIILSASPEQIGINRGWALYASVEAL